MSNEYIKIIKRLYIAVLAVFVILGCGSDKNSDDIVVKGNEENIKPIANAGEDITISYNKKILLTGKGSDEDGTIVSYEWKNGDISLATTAEFEYVIGKSGTDILTFIVTDNLGATASDTVKITGFDELANKKPIADSQKISVKKDSFVSIILTGNDFEGSVLTYTIVENPKNGTLNGIAPNIQYTPAQNYHGDDSFTFRVNDGLADSAIAKVNIMVSYDLPTLKTGQIESFETYDDGYYEKGADRNYVRNDENQIVKDITTGLEWLDTEEVKQTRNFTDASQYCTSLTLAGGGWKVPSIKDLQTITYDGSRDSSIDPIFENVVLGDSKYWSSTRYADLNYQDILVWQISYRDGIVRTIYKNNSANNMYVRCVRIGQ